MNPVQKTEWSLFEYSLAIRDGEMPRGNLLTIREAAQRSGLTESFIRTHARRDARDPIPHMDTGGSVCILTNGLEAWLGRHLQVC